MIFFAFHPSASFSQRIIIFHKRREKNYMKEMWKKKERNATTTTKQTENNQVCQVWVLCVIRALYTNNINFYWHCLMMIEYPWRYRFTLNGFVIEIYGLAQFFFFIFFSFFPFFSLFFLIQLLFCAVLFRLSSTINRNTMKMTPKTILMANKIYTHS